MKTYLIAVLTGVLLFSGCAKNDNGPSTADRDKFLGAWKANSSGPSGTFNFNMNITASNSAPDQILMENFDGHGSGTFVYASVSGSAFTIPRNILASDTIQGSGTYNSDNTLSFQFTVRDGQTVENRTGSAHR